jgi:uncharacterized membrane protein YbhN (UPF0104 family)
MRRLLALALKVAISVLLLYFALARVNLSVVGARLSQIEMIWLAAAVLILVVQVVSGALRWQQIVLHCGASDTPIFSLRRALRYSFMAAFFNQTLPSTVGGDAVRIWLLGRDGTGWRIATYSVLIDRLAGVLILALLVLICLPWSFDLIDSPTGRIALLVVGFGSASSCLMFLMLGFIRWRWLDRWWLPRHLIAATRIARHVLTSPSTGALVAIYSLLTHLMTVSAAWCLAKSVAAPLEWTQALLLVLPVLLIATIPLSIAGWGVRESTMIIAFAYAGLPESDGLVVSVLLGVALFAVGLLGGAVWIINDGKRLLMPAAEQAREP